MGEDWEPAILLARETFLNYEHIKTQRAIFDWIEIPTHLYEKHASWCEALPEFENWVVQKDYMAESPMNRLQVKLCSKKARQAIEYAFMIARLPGWFQEYKYEQLLKLLNVDDAIGMANQQAQDALAIELLEF